MERFRDTGARGGFGLHDQRVPRDFGEQPNVKERGHRCGRADLRQRGCAGVREIVRERLGVDRTIEVAQFEHVAVAGVLRHKRRRHDPGGVKFWEIVRVRRSRFRGRIHAGSLGTVDQRERANRYGNRPRRGTGHRLEADQMIGNRRAVRGERFFPFVECLD